MKNEPKSALTNPWYGDNSTGLAAAPYPKPAGYWPSSSGPAVGQQSSYAQAERAHDPEALAKIAWNSVMQDLQRRQMEAEILFRYLKVGVAGSLGVLVLAIAVRVLVGF